MDIIALRLVNDYIIKKSCNGYIPDIDFEIYIVWKCKTLQNWKYLISSTLEDGMYYELTFNGDKKEWYFDAYSKTENIVIKETDYDN